jgi:hypothetical protein
MAAPGSREGDGAFRELADRLADLLDGAVSTTGELVGIRGNADVGRRLSGLFRELGLVTRDEWEELDLRVAQLEHRLRLLERDPLS